MSQIVIGKAGNRNVALDLTTLLTTRMLLTADSGGGKTWALKRVCEQASGKIQIIIVDPEGEFAPLREKFPFVLAGKGGETPADVRSAEMLALTLLKTRANAVCDLYEMKSSERHHWVRLFLTGLLEAPKNLRHPCLVIVDEAHMFCPEKGKGESEASDAMKGLCTRGRKRLLCPLFATQRLAELDKGASGMLLNRAIGPTFEDVNRKRAAEVLSVAPDELHEFKKQIQLLPPGDFFVLGRAISKERILVRVGGIETPHGEEAMKYSVEPPPPPEAIAKLLPKLADLPKAAEEQARTVAEFRAEIRSLKAQLRAQPTLRPEVQKVAIADPRAIKRAVEYIERLRKNEFSFHGRTIRSLVEAIRRLYKSVEHLEVPEYRPAKVPEEIHSGPAVVAPAPVGGSIPAARSVPAANGELSPRQQAILRALAEFEAIGRSPIPKSWIAARSGASARSSAFTNNLGFLRSSGLIEYDGSGGVLLTAQGRQQAPSISAPLSSEEMLESCLKLLTQKQQLILKALYETHPNALSKEEVAQRGEASPTSSAFTNNLGALRSAGMIEYVAGGVKCADWLFIG